MAGWDDAISGLGDSFAGAVTANRKKKAAADFLAQLLGTNQINPVQVTPQVAQPDIPQLPGGTPITDPARAAAANAPLQSLQGGMLSSDPTMQKLGPILAAYGKVDPSGASSAVLPLLLKQFEQKKPEVYKPGDVAYAEGNYSKPLFSIPEKADKPEATPDIIQIAKQLFPTDPTKQSAYIMKNSPSNLRAVTNINQTKQNWQLLTDPKTNTQYRLDLDSGKAFGLDGQPYAPAGAGKISSGGIGRSPAAMYLKTYMDGHPDATPEQIQKAANDFKLGQSEAGTIGTRSGAADVASAEVEVFAQQAIDASTALPRSDYAALNSVLQNWDMKTSNPKLRRLMIAADALVNARARAISPTGSPHVNDQLEGRKMLAASFARGDFAEAVDQMQMEAKGVHSSTQSSKDSFLGNQTPAPGAAAAKKPPTVSNW